MNQIFSILKKDKYTRARIGILRLKHGEVKTPLYMPVATKGAVKTLLPQEVETIGFEMILSNTYHLIEKPGLEEIAFFGGINNYIGWKKPVLTDSGGYQVFSLHKHVHIEETGVTFRSLIDGKKIKATPEEVIEWQDIIGSDIAMVLDVCTPYGIKKESAEKALKITEIWAKRSIEFWSNSYREGRMLFGIVQGNFFKDLRIQATENLINLNFPGYAVGGLSVGEPKELMFEISDLVAQRLPEEKPRYFMGLGDPPSILIAIAQGYDMFDSALATRIARGGSFFTKIGPRNIRNSQLKMSSEKLDSDCSCLACENFTAGYIRHLYLSEETLALRLLTYHNLFFINKIIEEARHAIERGKYSQFLANFLDQYSENRFKKV